MDEPGKIMTVDRRLIETAAELSMSAREIVHFLKQMDSANRIALGLPEPVRDEPKPYREPPEALHAEQPLPEPKAGEQPSAQQGPQSPPRQQSSDRDPTTSAASFDAHDVFEALRPDIRSVRITRRVGSIEKVVEFELTPHA